HGVRELGGDPQLGAAALDPHSVCSYGPLLRPAARRGPSRAAAGHRQTMHPAPWLPRRATSLHALTAYAVATRVCPRTAGDLGYAGRARVVGRAAPCGGASRPVYHS